MIHDTLFDLPAPNGKVSTRHERAAKVRDWKKRHAIWTHYAEGCGWLAFSVPEACTLLKGYGLTRQEKRDPMLLFANYCRLIDEAGISADGAGTEFEAVSQIAGRLETDV
jgi:hypothetical protein